MKEKPNTLFLVANWGLHKIKNGIYESHMWILSDHDRTMKYLSLHEKKGKPAREGGEILEIRKVTKEDIDAHKKRLRDRGERELTASTAHRRMIIKFQLDEEWARRSIPWPEWSNRFDHKSTGYVKVKDSD